MVAGRMLPTLVATALLISGWSVQAEQGAYPTERVQAWGQAPAPHWPGQPSSNRTEQAAPTPGRYQPWSAGGDGARSVRSGNALGQRTWQTLSGDVGEAPAPVRPAKPQNVQQTPPVHATGGVYGGGIYGGVYGTSFGSLGLLGSSYLYGMPGYGDPSLFGPGVGIPLVWPW